jgi:sterol desaturase/sphingolipid hydroxylase (fatty acid hydroxylase superfamily)
MQLNEYLKIWSVIGSRYFMVAGTAFILFYLLLSRWISGRKIQARFPKAKDYLREIGYSVFTISLFAFIPLFFVMNESVRVHTTFYSDLSQYGPIWFWAAFPVMLLMHDTYFYWTHRLMHHPRLYPYFHRVHHLSVNPSPWAAYAFHPLEAVVEVGIFVVFLFTIPVHKLHFFLFFLFSIIYNVYGHLGWELYPKGFARTAVGRWINTSVSHNQHHKFAQGNYGLYLLFWDRVMGTLRPDYERDFDEVKNRKN